MVMGYGSLKTTGSWILQPSEISFLGRMTGFYHTDEMLLFAASLYDFMSYFVLSWLIRLTVKFFSISSYLEPSVGTQLWISTLKLWYTLFWNFQNKLHLTDFQQLRKGG
ncbi:hypothetical protein AMECASPLE_034472 [Ameca splendens]|uniref:Uncharacterized protein n=1 Tax=Ameca splendens TaxID=208324 RepID=A0ABV0ZHR2_9TELE